MDLQISSENKNEINKHAIASRLSGNVNPTLDIVLVYTYSVYNVIICSFHCVGVIYLIIGCKIGIKIKFLEVFIGS